MHAHIGARSFSASRRRDNQQRQQSPEEKRRTVSGGGGEGVDNNDSRSPTSRRCHSAATVAPLSAVNNQRRANATSTTGAKRFLPPNPNTFHHHHLLQQQQQQQHLHHQLVEQQQQQQQIIHSCPHSHSVSTSSVGSAVITPCPLCPRHHVHYHLQPQHQSQHQPQQKQQQTYGYTFLRADAAMSNGDGENGLTFPTPNLPPLEIRQGDDYYNSPSSSSSRVPPCEWSGGGGGGGKSGADQQQQQMLLAAGFDYQHQQQQQLMRGVGANGRLRSQVSMPAQSSPSLLSPLSPPSLTMMPIVGSHQPQLSSSSPPLVRHQHRLEQQHQQQQCQHEPTTRPSAVQIDHAAELRLIAGVAAAGVSHPRISGGDKPAPPTSLLRGSGANGLRQSASIDVSRDLAAASSISSAKGPKTNVELAAFFATRSASSSLPLTKPRQLAVSSSSENNSNDKQQQHPATDLSVHSMPLPGGGKAKKWANGYPPPPPSASVIGNSAADQFMQSSTNNAAGWNEKYSNSPPPLPSYEPEQLEGNVIETAIVDDDLPASTPQTPMSPDQSPLAPLISASARSGYGQRMTRGYQAADSFFFAERNGSPSLGMFAANNNNNNKNSANLVPATTRNSALAVQKVSVATDMSFHQHLNSAVQTDLPLRLLAGSNEFEYANQQIIDNQSNITVSEGLTGSGKGTLVVDNSFLYSSSSPAQQRRPLMAADEQQQQQQQQQRRPIAGESPRFLTLPSPSDAGFSGLSYSTNNTSNSFSNNHNSNNNHHHNGMMGNLGRSGDSSKLGSSVPFLEAASKAQALLTKVDVGSASTASSSAGCRLCRHCWNAPICACCKRSLKKIKGCSLVIIAAICLVVLIVVCIGALLGLGLTGQKLVDSSSSPSSPPPSNNNNNNNNNKLSLPITASMSPFSTLDPKLHSWYSFTPPLYDEFGVTRRPSVTGPTTTMSRQRSRLLDAEAADLQLCGAPSMVLCSNGECRPGGRCDFFTDCADLSDEQIGCDFGISASNQKRDSQNFIGNPNRRIGQQKRLRRQNFINY